jgi:hypothetical protein
MYNKREDWDKSDIEIEKKRVANDRKYKAENLPISGVVDFQPTAWKGDEFKHGDTAIIDWGNGKQTPCRVLGWTTPYGGWWYVQLENGGMHYTQRLVRK